MLKILKKIFFLISFFFLYLFLKEMFILYSSMDAVHPAAGYIFLVIIGAFIVYFIAMPVIRIFAMPSLDRPVKDPEKIPSLIEKRIKRFRKNRYLVRQGFDFSNIHTDRAGYEAVLRAFDSRIQEIRKKYVTQVFYTTAVAQNGFLDGLIILSAGVHLIQDIFTLYHGRVYTRDILYIMKQVYYSMLIGGSEGVEYAADEIISKLFTGSIKNLPFASKIFGSIADGFVNAALMTRIALITENACKRIFIESNTALYPSYASVFSATRILTSDILNRLAGELKSVSTDKTRKVLLATVNPVGYLLGRTMAKYAEESDAISGDTRLFMQEASAIAYNPFSFVFKKVSGLFRKKQADDLV